MKKISINNLLKCIGILCGTAILLGLTSCSSGGDTETIDLLPVQTNREGRWSMIDSKGNIVYDSEFENMPTMVINGCFSVKENDGYALYRAGGKNPEVVNGCENLNAVGIMEDGLVPIVRQEKRIEIVNKSGETVFELSPIDSVEVFSCENKFNNGLLAVMTTDYKCGFVDKSGKLVIPCIYDSASSFENGYSIVSKRNEEGAGTETYYVIDTSGDVEFKIGQSMSTPVFFCGYVLTSNDDHYNLVDMDGDEHKLPSKLRFLRDMKDDMIIYQDEDGNSGLATLEGEILIRPKYYSLQFAFDGSLIAKKEPESHEVLILDTDGDEKQTLDMDEIHVIAGFGYLGAEGRSFTVIDDEFKEVCKEEFYGRSDSKASGTIQSDYVNREIAADKFVSSILDDGMGVKECKFGQTAESLMAEESPRNYAHASEGFYKSEDICMSFRMQGKYFFTMNMASFSENGGYYKYEWNPSSKLCMLLLTLDCPREWGMPGHMALLNSMKKKGFSIIKEGMMEATYSYTSKYAFATLMKKGNVIAIVMDFDKLSKIQLIPGNIFPQAEEAAKSIIFGKYTAGQDGSVNQAEAESIAPDGIGNFERFRSQLFIDLRNK